ncbi:hypothetical protein [Streptomyces microflavus]|uniref:hypothetical protein n=1 Tax=Streptomyces microflavus TaxID=1919 RepID=UPI0036CCE616
MRSKSQKKTGQPTAAAAQAAVDSLGYGKPQKATQGKVLSSTTHPPITPSEVSQVENAVALTKKHLTRALVKKVFDEDPEGADRLSQEITSWAATATKAAPR